jgi:hypothetical protein
MPSKQRAEAKRTTPGFGIMAVSQRNAGACSNTPGAATKEVSSMSHHQDIPKLIPREAEPSNKTPCVECGEPMPPKVEWFDADGNLVETSLWGRHDYNVCDECGA